MTNGIHTLCILTLSKKTLNLAIFSITTKSTMTLFITLKNAILSIGTPYT
jgi:hypothetical protein